MHILWMYLTSLKPHTKKIFLPTPLSILDISVTLLGTPQTFLEDAALLAASAKGTDLSSQVVILSHDQHLNGLDQE